MNRRQFLAALGGSLGATLVPVYAVANTTKPRRFVFVVEGNGIDPVALMSGDARRFRGRSMGYASSVCLSSVPIAGLELGDLDGDVATYDTLATESGIGRESGSLIELVLLVLFHLGEILLSGPDDHVAGRTGAVSTAIVLEFDPVLLCDVQDRPGSAVIAEGKVLIVHFDDEVLGKEGDFVFHGFAISSTDRVDKASRIELSMMRSANGLPASFTVSIRSRMTL